MSRKLCKRCLVERPSLLPAFKVCLKVRTNRSTAPFVDGWYGADLVCLIPFSRINCENSSEIN